MSEIRKAGSEEFKEELAEAARDPNYEARLKLSEDPESAAARAAKVGDGYDVSGYTDKQISMALQGDRFGDEDYARLIGKKLGGGESEAPSKEEPVVVVPDDETPIVITPGEGGGDGGEIGLPAVPIGETPKSFLAQYIKDSFNAKGGTLTNSGDISAGGDVTFDNSVSNANKVNQIASNGYRLDLGDLRL